MSQFISFEPRVQEDVEMECVPSHSSARPKPGVAKDTAVAELKTREICRVIYPLNKCGSKQVIIAMDPAEDFHPVVTIGKAGWSGFRLDSEALDILMQNLDYINDFFNTPSVFASPLHLNAVDSIEFRRNWGKQILCFSNKMDTQFKVCIGKPTWEGFLEILPLLHQVKCMYKRWQSDALAVFIGICKYMKNCLPAAVIEKLPIVEDSLTFNNVLRRCSYENITFEGNPDTLLDLKKCFLEIRIFCQEHIASYIPYV